MDGCRTLQEVSRKLQTTTEGCPEKQVRVSSVVVILASKLKSVSEMQDEFSVYERINEICPIKRNQM